MISDLNATCYCIAQESWHYGASFLPRYDRQCWVTCFPMTGPNGEAYDRPYMFGDEEPPLPQIQIMLLLRRGSIYKDPNVMAGNRLAYRAASAQIGSLPGGGGVSTLYFEAVGNDYLDDPVGSIKPFATALPASLQVQGWGVMDGVHNDAGMGGSGINAMSQQRILRPGTPGHTGGNNAHTHPLTSGMWASENFPYGTFGYAPDTAAAATDLPIAYAEIGGWLERLNNGQQ